MKQADMYITDENYNILFNVAYNSLNTLISYYPIIKPSFSKNLSFTLDVFGSYKVNKGALANKIGNYFSIKKVEETDNANREIIYTLADTYFLTAIWYNAFKLATNYQDSNAKKIGNANNDLASYLKNLIYKYKLGSDFNKQDTRDIGASIGMSWTVYADMVNESLAYINARDKQAYYKLVNIAITEKLGLSPIYREAGI